MDTTLHSWNECALWKILSDRDDVHARECRTTLERVMPKIEAVLKSGGTSPKDFTLHDEGHSYRVAERMRAITGDVTEILSSFELTLLIMSAYLHDIGMTPEFKKVQANYQYLLTGQPTNLTETDVASLQTWLDDAGYEIVPPISDTMMPLADRLHLAGELTTYYCRHRHNDWSAEWIREHLKDESLGSYDGWLEDLVLLCQSHHFGGPRLKEAAFTARWVGELPAVVNLRYLALVLRTADILEFDPERTPDVILHHRDIAPESLIYWWKDKGLSLKLTDRQIVISARPSVARLHKAIEEMVNAIDAELTLARNLADESPLGAVPGSTEPLPYQWTLAPATHRDIAPREGTYEYIDGAFRPDTGKLLSLLSGVSLYQNPIVAVRELVQNAFDAVGERVGYQRLGQRNPASAVLAGQLAKQHRVELRVEAIGSDAYLICSDTGVGMTKAIIRDRVLVSGSGPRHDVRALDRTCNAAGFQLRRSGQFGIGVLSYFMLADRIEIETQRAQEAGDSDSTTWSFSTEGIGAFGELRKLGGLRLGTKVRLRLRSAFSSNLTDWYSDLRSYLIRVLASLPCELTLSSPLPGCDPLSLEPGWSPQDLSESAFKKLRPESDRRKTAAALLSSSERDRRLAKERQLLDLETEFKSCLRWCREEGVLAGGILEYQINLPYFDLEGGASLAFMRVTKIRRFQESNYFMPQGYREFSWKGMVVEAEDHWVPDLGVARLNWLLNSAGTILVDRHTFSPSALAETAMDEVQTKLSALTAKFVEEHQDSEYVWLNDRLAEFTGPVSNRCRWFYRTGGEEENEATSWADIKFPAVSALAFISAKLKPSSLGSKPIHAVPMAISRGNIVGWHSRLIPPDRIVELNSAPFHLAPIWLRRPRSISHEAWLQSGFPQEWGRLCGATFEWYAASLQNETVWNRRHRLVTISSRSAWDWAKAAFASSLDPIPQRTALLSDSDKAACWLRLCISTDSRDLWEGLEERDPQLLKLLFEVVLGPARTGKNTPLLFWVEGIAQKAQLRVISAQKWTAVTKLKEIRQYLPEPPSMWRLVSVGKARVPRGH